MDSTEFRGGRGKGVFAGGELHKLIDLINTVQIALQRQMQLILVIYHCSCISWLLLHQQLETVLFGGGLLQQHNQKIEYVTFHLKVE